MENEGIFALYKFLLTSAKLIRHFKKLLLMFSQHKLISICAMFHCYFAYRSEFTGSAFLTSPTKSQDT